MSCGFKHNILNICSAGAGTCLNATCCPCFALGKTMYIAENNGSEDGYSPINVDCLVIGFLGGHSMGWLWNVYRRGELRKKLNIGTAGGCGDICCDLCASSCLSCALIQQRAEVKDRFENEKAPVTKQYAPQQGMNPNRM